MLNRLLYWSPTITGVLVEPDPELVKRNEELIQRAKKLMGEKYLLHPSNHVKKVSAKCPTSRS